MRITALFPTLLAALACGVAAKNFTDASPFELVVLSKNHTLNGSRFDACHTGAAETTLCLLNLPAPSSPVPTGYAGSVFYFNTSDYQSPPYIEGYISNPLHAGNLTVPSPLMFRYSAASNVANVEFLPTDLDEGTSLAFDTKGKLTWLGYVDDRREPYQPSGGLSAYYRWYVCITYVGSGYTYQALTWVLGAHSPQNPTCQAVDVVRNYV